MNTILKFLLAVLISQCPLHYRTPPSQLLGLWEMTKVSMGDQEMTPVSKWTRINKDGTFQSGNGWLQSSHGTWNWDADKSYFTPSDLLGIKDEFGGFTVSISGDNMTWKRDEDGVVVTVELVRIDNLPMSPADYLEGLWDLVEITENQKSITDEFDPNDQHRLFIRWDRLYNNYSPEGSKSTGYWHINGHRPEITLLPHTDGKQPESWSIEVDEKLLIMSGISDSNHAIQRKYSRRNSF